ncbi:hypothetical protein ACHAPT_012558 [Fusarium lateritium]
MAGRRDSLPQQPTAHKRAKNRRAHRVSDPNLYPPHPQVAPTSSAPPLRSSSASYTTQPVPYRPTPGRDAQRHARAGHPLPPRPTRPRNTFDGGDSLLTNVESMQLKTVENSEGVVTGLTIVNDDAPHANNIYTTLPLPNGGIIFSTGSERGAAAAYGRTTRDAQNVNVVGIMFAPPHGSNGLGMNMRNVDWDCLAPPATKIDEADGGFRLSELQGFVPQMPSPPERLRKHQ